MRTKFERQPRQDPRAKLLLGRNFEFLARLFLVWMFVANAWPILELLAWQLGFARIGAVGASADRYVAAALAVFGLAHQTAKKGGISLFLILIMSLLYTHELILHLSSTWTVYPRYSMATLTITLADFLFTVFALFIISAGWRFLRL